MKYKVIGWTDWENGDVPTGHASDAATQAIIDDIREHGYMFTGWDHQESMNCAPVLNDGKKRLYTQRGFGGIMAEAYGYLGSMDYARFSFKVYSDDYNDGMPPLELEFDPDKFVPEDISEHYIFEVSREQFESAERDRLLVIDDNPEIRFIDFGDRVTLKCDGESAEYEISRVSKEKEFSEEDQIALYCHKEGAEEKWQNAKVIATIYF